MNLHQSFGTVIYANLHMSWGSVRMQGVLICSAKLWELNMSNSIPGTVVKVRPFTQLIIGHQQASSV